MVMGELKMMETAYLPNEQEMEKVEEVWPKKYDSLKRYMVSIVLSSPIANEFPSMYLHI